VGFSREGGVAWRVSGKGLIKKGGDGLDRKGLRRSVSKTMSCVAGRGIKKKKKKNERSRSLRNTPAPFGKEKKPIGQSFAMRE